MAREVSGLIPDGVDPSDKLAGIRAVYDCVNLATALLLASKSRIQTRSEQKYNLRCLVDLDRAVFTARNYHVCTRFMGLTPCVKTIKAARIVRETWMKGVPDWNPSNEWESLMADTEWYTRAWTVFCERISKIASNDELVAELTAQDNTLSFACDIVRLLENDGKGWFTLNHVAHFPALTFAADDSFNCKELTRKLRLSAVKMKLCRTTDSIEEAANAVIDWMLDKAITLRDEAKTLYDVERILVIDAIKALDREIDLNPLKDGNLPSVPTQEDEVALVEPESQTRPNSESESGTELSTASHHPDVIEELERKTPQLDTESGEWLPAAARSTNSIVTAQASDDANVKPKNPKRGNPKGETRDKLISALTLHHKYADGGCLNQEPITVRKLAKQAGVSKTTAARFLVSEFREYQKFPRDKNLLLCALKQLNNEYTPGSLLLQKDQVNYAREDE